MGLQNVEAFPLLRVAVTADIHCPRYIELLEEALRKTSNFDLLLLVGDLVLKNDFTQLGKVVSTIRGVYSGKVIACFGNEEYEQSVEDYRKESEVTWLDDEAMILSIKGVNIGIVGSRGALDRPTFWQRTRVKGVWQLYRRRLNAVDGMLAGLKADVVAVLTHYAPTYETLEGERENAWPEMACRGFQAVIQRRQPDLWVHGHAHMGKPLQAVFGKTRVVNVSLPARKEVVELDLPGLVT